MYVCVYVCLCTIFTTVLKHIYISERPCEALSAPKHGTLACDSNKGGAFCNMMCQKDWDIPRSALPVPVFECGWSTGRWNPTADVPDCSGEWKMNIFEYCSLT